MQSPRGKIGRGAGGLRKYFPLVLYVNADEMFTVLEQKGRKRKSNVPHLPLPRLPSQHLALKAGVNMKAVSWLGSMVLTQTSCSRFKQSKISLFIPHIHVLGCLLNFLVIFGYIWG